MNEKKIRRRVKRTLFEFIELGFDYHYKPREEPIFPEEQMSAQYTTEKSQINDEDFMPVTSKELAKALYTMFQDIPHDQVGFVYNNSKRLFDKAMERGSSIDFADPAIDDVEEIKNPINI